MRLLGRWAKGPSGSLCGISRFGRYPTCTHPNGGCALQPPELNVDKVIRAATEHRRLIRLVYRNKDRVVEPHDYGILNGTVKPTEYQVGGSSSGKLPNWRWIETGLISDIHLLDRTFPGGRPNPSGKHHKWGELFMRVKPAKNGPLIKPSRLSDFTPALRVDRSRFFRFDRKAPKTAGARSRRKQSGRVPATLAFRERCVERPDLLRSRQARPFLRRNNAFGSNDRKQ